MELKRIRYVTDNNQSLHPYDEVVVYSGSSPSEFNCNSSFKYGQCFTVRNDTQHNLDVIGNIDGATSVRLTHRQALNLIYNSTGFYSL